MFTVAFLRGNKASRKDFSTPLLPPLTFPGSEPAAGKGLPGQARCWERGADSCSFTAPFSFIHSHASLHPLARVFVGEAPSTRGVRAVPAPCCGRGKGPRDSLVPAWRSCGLGDPSAESAHAWEGALRRVMCPLSLPRDPRDRIALAGGWNEGGSAEDRAERRQRTGLGTAPHSAVLWPRHTGR